MRLMNQGWSWAALATVAFLGLGCDAVVDEAIDDEPSEELIRQATYSPTLEVSPNPIPLSQPYTVSGCGWKPVDGGHLYNVYLNISPANSTWLYFDHVDADGCWSYSHPAWTDEGLDSLTFTSDQEINRSGSASISATIDVAIVR